VHLRPDDNVSTRQTVPPSVDGGADARPSLVARARSGDAEAFGALYGQHAPMVHAVLLAAVRPADAEDLLQEVFLAAWKGMAGLRSDEQVGAWLAVIARNAARRFHSRARPRPEPIPELLPDRLALDGARVAEGTEMLELVRALPQAYRETMLMRLVEGMSGPEISSATGLTPDSVRTNLSRGMKLLRNSLRKRGWT